jgi:hypothetical protein
MPNALIHSTSPYLLQHAHNPVRWMEWGAEAFALARTKDVPIFVSVGYSTCYWCHVMERESFEDADTAALMNEHFVCVKVDREQRPDVDDLTMAATLAMTGRGGWPTSVFLEPASLAPFYCGTYFPREARFAGVPTFRQVLQGISHAWKTQRTDVLAQARQLSAAVQEQSPPFGAPGAPLANLDNNAIASCVQSLLAIFDKQHGGFGQAPKFPQVVFIEFLLDAREVVDDATRRAIDAALRTTLDAMSLGGLHDHLGGGFHRYSVDAHWTVPHFEKMLYDQAQMLRAYASASRALQDPWYAEVARAVVEHMSQDLSQPSGLFSSAQDAESEHREGRSYVWTASEARECLISSGFDEQQSQLVLAAYGLASQPNFVDPHHPSEPPTWVLRLRERPDATAQRAGVDADAFAALLARARSVLLMRRASRVQPATDDKAVACWNGLAIDALARTAIALDERAPLELASDAADALLSMPPIEHVAQATRAGATTRTTTQRPARSWRDTGKGPVPSGQGFLEDAAATAQGLLALARAATNTTARRMRLAQAREVLLQAMQFSADAHASNPADGPEGSADAALFANRMSLHDGAMPSGFSLRLHALLDLFELSDDASEKAQLSQAVQQQLTWASATIADKPVLAINAVRALLRTKVLMPDVAQALASLVPNETAHETVRRATSPTTTHRSQQSPLQSDDVVEVLATTEQVVLAQGTPAELLLHIAIAPGYHIVAAQPFEAGDDTRAALDGLVPLRVDVFNGSGVQAYADYPQGTLWPSEALSRETGLPRIRVHEGTLELRVALEREGSWQGNPLLCVRFQACTDRECLAPTTVELDIALIRA